MRSSGNNDSNNNDIIDNDDGNFKGDDFHDRGNDNNLNNNDQRVSELSTVLEAQEVIITQEFCEIRDTLTDLDLGTNIVRDNARINRTKVDTNDEPNNQYMPVI